MSAERLELSTNGLKGHCSTIELRARRECYFNMPCIRRQRIQLNYLWKGINYFWGEVCAWPCSLSFWFAFDVMLEWYSLTGWSKRASWFNASWSYSLFPQISHTQAGKSGTVIISSFNHVKYVTLVLCICPILHSLQGIMLWGLLYVLNSCPHLCALYHLVKIKIRSSKYRFLSRGSFGD